MPLLDQIRADKLIQLARERFDPNLWEMELKVVSDSASSKGLPYPDENAPRSVIRAEFLRWLASDPETAPHIDPKGLRVYGATIAGSLDLERCRVRQTLEFRRCAFRGEIDLFCAETRGIFVFDCSLALGIRADGVVVRGPILLLGSESEDEIRLHGAEIAGDLDCSGTKLKAKTSALTADRARIGGGVFLIGQNGRQFQSEGTIRLVSAEIGGVLDFNDAKVAEVRCDDLQVAGGLSWLRIEKSDRTKLHLSGARVKNLRDDRKSWPLHGSLDIDGLVYEELTLHMEMQEANVVPRRLSAELPLVARERIEWLMLQGPDRSAEPQPWMQLRDLLEKKGDRKGAKHVLYKFRCLQASQGSLLSRRMRVAFAWLEEAPSRIQWLVGMTLLIFTSLFWYAGASGALAPTEPEAYKAFTSGKPMRSAYPQLNPFVYTVDNAMPLAKLGQDDKWAPDHRYPSTNLLTNYWFLMWARWILLVWGWFQAAVLGAAIVSRFKS